MVILKAKFSSQIIDSMECQQWDELDADIIILNKYEVTGTDCPHEDWRTTFETKLLITVSKVVVKQHE